MQGEEPELPDGVVLGEIFAERYRLGAIIGHGAMGIVVSAHDRRLDIAVAIKVLRAPIHDREAVARFVQEARAAARLRSEHAVRVSDVAVHPSGVAYIVMERLIGKNLAELLRAKGPVAADVAIDWILQACEAVDEAHRRGTVHRDLKPANLFLADRERGEPAIKVLDFGIAKNMAPGGDTIDGQQSLSGHPATTHQRAILGSPFYMSPEQMESAGDVDARTDVWALGITLYELVVGELPYRGTSLLHVYTRMTMTGEHDWKARLVRIAPGLVPILTRCLQRDRDARYESVADLAADLAPLGSSRAMDSEHRIRSAPNKTTGDPLERVTPPSVPPSSRPATSTVRIRSRWSAGALMAVVGALGAAAWHARTSVTVVGPPVSPGPPSADLPPVTGPPTQDSPPKPSSPLPASTSMMPPTPLAPSSTGKRRIPPSKLSISAALVPASQRDDAGEPLAPETKKPVTFEDLIKGRD